MSTRMNRCSVRVMITMMLAGLLASGCSIGLPKLSIPRVHKITVQQGNVITQEMIDRLKPGMSRSQVAYVMGEPVMHNIFDDGRWDYIYTLDVPGYFNQAIHMTLYFENEVLAYFTGDMAPTAANPDAPVDAESDGGDTTEQVTDEADAA